MEKILTDEEEFQLIKKDVEQRKAEQNKKYANLTEEEVIASMVKGIKESVDFAKKNNIEVVTIEE